MTRPSFAVKCSTLSIAFLALAGWSAVQTPTGDLRTATMADLKPHPSSSKTYNEFWTYQFYFEGDIQACLNFSRVNAGSFKSPVCGADLGIIGLKGRNFVVAREYDKSNFIFTDSLSQLRVHENIWFQGKLPEEHRVHFVTTKRGVSYYLDLAFTDILPGKVWGDGIFKVDGDQVGIFIHIPYAKVSGRMAVNGDTMDVKGRAYMDHTYQTDLAPKLVNGGYRYVSRTPPLNVGYFLQPNSGTLPVGYGLKEENGSLRLMKPSALKTLTTARSLDVTVPSTLEIDFKDSTKTVLKRDDERYRLSFLWEFNWLEKRAIRAVMGGEVKTFKGMGTLDSSQHVGYDFFVVD
jgi:hypothetical protein